MKRLTAVLAFVALIGSGGVPAWAQQVDPLALGFTSPGALEGSFITDTAAQLQFLILASPRLCNDASDPDLCENRVHLWFYTAACNRVDDAAVTLTENDVEILPLHSPLLTSVRAGNVLVAATPPSGPFDQPILATNSVLGLTYYIDVNRGIGRIEELSRLSNNNGNGWSPYKPVAIIPLALPDNGSSIFETLLIRCPQGTALVDREVSPGPPPIIATFVVGTEGTLGGDMLDLALQDEGFSPGDAYSAATTFADEFTICDDCDTNGLFASALTAIIYDLDENFLRSVDNLPCQCLGVAPQGGAAFDTEVRLSDLAAIAGVEATYWEVFSFGAPSGDELFTGSMNTQLRVVNLNLNFFSRLHNTNARENIIP
jgi:hypothetical protein